MAQEETRREGLPLPHRVRPQQEGFSRPGNVPSGGTASAAGASGVGGATGSGGSRAGWAARTLRAARPAQAAAGGATHDQNRRQRTRRSTTGSGGSGLGGSTVGSAEPLIPAAFPARAARTPAPVEFPIRAELPLGRGCDHRRLQHDWRRGWQGWVQRDWGLHRNQ